MAHSFFADCPTEVNFDDLKSLISENKQKPMERHLNRERIDSDVQIVGKGISNETVDLTQKPSLLGKRTANDANLNGAAN